MTSTEEDLHEDVHPQRQRLTVALAIAAMVPGVAIRFADVHMADPLAALLFGLAIVGAAFLLSWAAEVAQLDISAGLAIALLAFIAVLPEYAVDLVFALKGGDAFAASGFTDCPSPIKGQESPCSLALANMTGANRLLIGVGWTLVVYLAWRQYKKQGSPERGKEIQLDRGHAVELSFLAVATLWSLFIPLRGSITIVDAVVLVSLFILYTIRISRAPAEEPHLVGPARWIGGFSVTQRRMAVVGLFVLAAAVILLCAEHFAEALVASGESLGVSEFLLVQWLAPLASEAPELLVAGLYAWRLNTNAGLGTLVSSKVNQWTLLVGTLPIAFAFASGSRHGLPIDGHQREELFLTAAQSAFAVAILINLSMSTKEAKLMFGLFVAAVRRRRRRAGVDPQRRAHRHRRHLPAVGGAPVLGAAGGATAAVARWFPDELRRAKRQAVTAAGFDRAANLARLGAESFDVLVIGGGITGAGVALDAASRGLAVALIDKGDFAAGTSSKSSKLVHGGLRYLQQREIRLVYENLHERQRLLKNAPHLVEPLPFLIPLFGKDGAVSKTIAKAYAASLRLYDMTGGVRIGHRYSRLSPEEASKHLPTLRPDRLVAAFMYWDARADDARLTLTIARTAADHGAVIANYAGVESLTRDGERINGAVLDDGTTVKAQIVVNATGVWADHIQRLDGSGEPAHIRPAKGVHVTVPRTKVPADIAVVVPVPGDRRSIFVVPWGDRVYLGTTDTDYDGPIENPTCTDDDVAYLLSAINAATTETLTNDDVLGTWAGLRPLIADAKSTRTADLSRRHSVTTSPAGVVTVTGGKLTTYRAMAADTVDVVTKSLGRGGRSQTKRLKLHGATKANDALAKRFGTDAAAVAALIASDASLGEPLVEGLPYVRAEAVWSARHEMVHTLADVLARRTRALLLDRDATVAAAPVGGGAGGAGTRMVQRRGGRAGRGVLGGSEGMTEHRSEAEARRSKETVAWPTAPPADTSVRRRGGMRSMAAR